MKEQWEKEIQQKLADYSVPAPELSWTEIEAAIDKSQKCRVVMLRRRRITVAAAIVLLIMGLCFVDLQPSVEKIAKDGKEKTEKIDSKKDPEYIAEAKHWIKQHSMKHVQKTITAVKDMIVDEKIIVVEDSTKAIADSGKKHDEGEQKSLRADDKRTYNRGFYGTAKGKSRSHTIGSSTLTAKVFVSNVFGSNSSNASGPMLLAANPFYDNDPSMTSTGNTQIQNRGEEISTSVRHHQPIRFGVSIRYGLSERWSIEGGLSYTYISSDIDKTSGNCTYATEQKLSYVGIPVNMNYNIWSDKRFNIYASGGITTEKMVKGKSTTRIVTDGKTESTTGNDIKINPLQFSVNGGIGAEYNIDGTFSIYAEPKIGYYIDNGSDVTTLYKDKPLNFNINVGLRLNIK